MVAYCKTRGKKLDLILRQLRVSSSTVTAGRGANPVADTSGSKAGTQSAHTCGGDADLVWLLQAATD